MLFRDEASKAQELLSQDREQDMFQSVFAPHKTFPCVVRFHGLDGVQMIKLTKGGATPEEEAALFNEGQSTRVSQQEELKNGLVAATQTWMDTSFRFDFFITGLISNLSLLD